MLFEIGDILQVYKARDYKIFSNDKYDYNLNLFGIRNEFYDDTIGIFWQYKKNWTIKYFKGTTDPTRYWLTRPMNPKGCARLKEGQWFSLWKLGYHREYRALVQYSPCVVERDNDYSMHFGDSPIIEERGMFGINLHWGATDKASAGCQVIYQQHDFLDFMNIIQAAAEIYGDIFSYTLLNEVDFI